MDLVEEILKREEKYHLCEKQIDGFQFWQYERFYIYKNMRTPDKPFKKPKIKKWKLLKYYITHRGQVRRGTQIDICFLAHPRRCLKEEKYECIYTDEIAKKFPHSVTLERFYEEDHLEPAQSPNMVYMDRVIIEAALYGVWKMNLCRRSSGKIEKNIYAEINGAMCGLLTPEQVVDSAHRAAGAYYRYRYTYKRLKKMLTRMNPKIVVEVVSYSQQCMIVNEICKELGITTIELQHGWIGKNHLAYNYPAGSVIRQFPDKIYLFGDYYKNDIRCPISKDKLISVGFPYYERELEKYREHQRMDKRYTVLFLSQGRFTRGLSDAAVELYKITDSRKVRIIYKLHPSEYEDWKEIHPKLESSGVEIVGKDGIPLYDCFRTSDAQVGVYSTTIFEGLGFQLRTFIYHQEFSDYLRGLLDLGIAELVESAADLWEKIKTGSTADYRGEYFWKENALMRLERELCSELEARTSGDSVRGYMNGNEI